MRSSSVNMIQLNALFDTKIKLFLSLNVCSLFLYGTNIADSVSVTWHYAWQLHVCVWRYDMMPDSYMYNL